MAASSREAVCRAMTALAGVHRQCPMHNTSYSVLRRGESLPELARRRYAKETPSDTEYAFEMACSNIRYGPGVTREVGMDFRNLNLKKIGVVTDKTIARLPPLSSALESLTLAGVDFEVFESVSIEPDNDSFSEAILFGREGAFDGFLAVGGGSVMDSAKVANLFACYPESDLMDFVAVPHGKGKPILKQLKPLICVPTTAGTGSETTGIAVFDHKPLKTKIAISNRALRPTLGMVDPLHMKHMPRNVAVYTGFDVLCPAIESYTIIPYNQRKPRPSDPALRPSYQGSNPISDIWSLHALQIVAKYFKRAVNDCEDTEARAAMHLASTMTGVGFGNAGVHLCHGLSYPISGQVKSFTAEDYDKDKPLVPHGLSVVITAPAVFSFTAPMCPERHLEAAEILGASTANVRREDAGRVLADVVREYMQAMGIQNGITELGFSREDIPALVQGALPQKLEYYISRQCPMHNTSYSVLRRGESLPELARRRYAKETPETEYAFEMACSNIRYGPGVTREVGMDFRNLNLKKIGVMTDKTIARLPPLSSALESLTLAGVDFEVFESVSIEPDNDSFSEAMRFGREGAFDGFLAVGGGSVMDSAKVANLFSCYPESDLMDFVAVPHGKGKPILKQLKPLVCVPTTAGTGSETTGAAVFDHKLLRSKTAIANRALRPTLGLVDPLHMKHMPRNVAVYSGFDVLCHALESYTAVPYEQRKPRPSNPSLRPAYQGSNPISDIWSLHALRIIAKYFKRAVNDSVETAEAVNDYEDTEARAAMHLSSAMAGVGFGNAGVHLCHGLSYPISGQVKSFTAEDYDKDKPLVPHGLSVVITAPAVFSFTAPMCPERHLEAAEILGANTANVRREDAGRVLADVVREYMQAMGIQNGITELGFSREDIPALVQGALPQERVLKLSPKNVGEEELTQLLEESLTVY